MDVATQFPSNNLLKEALEELGYSHEFITLDTRSFSRYTSPLGNVWLTSNALRIYPFLNSTAKLISSEKVLGYTLAESLGINVPCTYIVREEQAISQIPTELLDKKPLVVKPNNASLSNGLTVGITTDDELTSAVARAKEFDPSVLIQQQVTGEEARFAIVDGKCKAVILRRTPRVVGDGTHTLAQLLEIENNERINLKLPYAVYPKLEEPLVDFSGLDMSHVPAEGKIIELGKSSMIRRGASAYNITNSIHASYVKIAEKLASALGNGFIVVDMFMKDYEVPVSDDNYAFLEYNMSPNLPLFYCCRDGNHYDIISELVPLIDKAINGGKVSKA